MKPYCTGRVGDNEETRAVTTDLSNISAEDALQSLASAIVRIAHAAGAKSLAAMTGPQLLDLAEQTCERVATHEVDAAGLRSVCRVLTDVGVPETMSATEGVHWLAERAALAPSVFGHSGGAS